MVRPDGENFRTSFGEILPSLVLEARRTYVSQLALIWVSSGVQLHSLPL